MQVNLNVKEIDILRRLIQGHHKMLERTNNGVKADKAKVLLTKLEQAYEAYFSTSVSKGDRTIGRELGSVPDIGDDQTNAGS